MKSKIFTLFLGIAIAATACKKDDSGKGPDSVSPKKPTLDLLAQTWILKTTYRNDTVQTENGTGKYQFDRFGSFMFHTGTQFQTIANYSFIGSDSASMNVTFTGTTTPNTWVIKRLTETEFNTEFFINGNKLNYNYTR